MIISHSRRFVFVHVHKTAGESITKALAPHLGRGDIVLGGTLRGNLANIWYRRRHGLSKHSSAAAIRDFMGEASWSNTFRFSVVRNPYDRIVSFHAYLRKMLAKRRAEGVSRLMNPLPGFDVRDPLKWPEMTALLETTSFSEFIRHPAFGPHQFGTRPQHSVLADEGGHLLVDMICRFETLGADFTEVAQRLGIPEARLGWHNASGNSRGAGATLSAADRDLLWTLYRDDFETFGYARDAA